VDSATPMQRQLPFDDRSFEAGVEQQLVPHWASQVAGFEEIGPRTSSGRSFHPTDPFAVGWRSGGSDPPSRSNVYQERGGRRCSPRLVLSCFVWERVSIVGPLASYFVVAAAPTWLRNQSATVDAGLTSATNQPWCEQGGRSDRHNLAYGIGQVRVPSSPPTTSC